MSMEKEFKKLKGFLTDPYALTLIFLFTLVLYLFVVEPVTMTRTGFITGVLGVSTTAIIGYVLISAGMAMLPTPLFKIGFVFLVIGLFLAAGSIIGVYVFLKNNWLLVLGLLAGLIIIRVYVAKQKTKKQEAFYRMMQTKKTEQHHHHYYNFK